LPSPVHGLKGNQGRMLPPSGDGAATKSWLRVQPVLPKGLLAGPQGSGWLRSHALLVAAPPAHFTSPLSFPSWGIMASSSTILPNPKEREGLWCHHPAMEAQCRDQSMSSLWDSAVRKQSSPPSNAGLHKRMKTPQ
jgi:hypothetical protein